MVQKKKKESIIEKFKSYSISRYTYKNAKNAQIATFDFSN